MEKNESSSSTNKGDKIFMIKRQHLPKEDYFFFGKVDQLLILYV